MSNWTTREDLIHQVVALHAQGRSRRAIARRVGVGRNTVRHILAEHAKDRARPHMALAARPLRAPRATKLDVHRTRVDKLLAEYPELTAQRVYEELRDVGFEGSYTAVKTYVRQVRPAPAPEPSMPTDVPIPGQTAESDWSPFEIDFTSGLRMVVQVFSYVLRYSTRKYYGLYEHADIHALMDGHVAAFARFGGAAEETKYDSQKAVVRGWEGDQPIYNPRFLAFAAHYEFRPVACRRNHPDDKPRVERSFYEFEMSFLNGRRFYDLEDMRAQLGTWLSNVVDTRPHKKIKRPRLELFEEERPHLRPLPTHPYDTARVIYRLANIEGFVSWDGNRYAVPYDHVTEILPIRITQKELIVYAADLRVVARHELAPKSAGLDLDPNGLHRPTRTRNPAAEQAQLEQAFARMGERASAYFSALCTAEPRQSRHYARLILQMRERYATDDILGALAHAQEYGAFHHLAIARILAARARPRSLAEHVTEDAAARFDPTPFVQLSDLDEYDRLPVSSSPTMESTACPSDPPTTSTPSSSDSDDTSKS